MRARGRRGATCNAELARYRLRKVLMMVSVVRCFRNITNRLSSFSPIQRLRSPRSSHVLSEDFKNNTNTELNSSVCIFEKNDKVDHVSHYQISSIVAATAMSDAAAIATAAIVAGGINISSNNVETSFTRMLTIKAFLV